MNFSQPSHSVETCGRRRLSRLLGPPREPELGPAAGSHVGTPCAVPPAAHPNRPRLSTSSPPSSWSLRRLANLDISFQRVRLKGRPYDSILGLDSLIHAALSLCAIRVASSLHSNSQFMDVASRIRDLDGHKVVSQTSWGPPQGEWHPHTFNRCHHH